MPDPVFRRLAVKRGLKPCDNVCAAWCAYRAPLGSVVDDFADLELVGHALTVPQSVFLFGRDRMLRFRKRLKHAIGKAPVSAKEKPGPFTWTLPPSAASPRRWPDRARRRDALAAGELGQ